MPERPPWDWIIVGLLLPVVGVVLAIILFARNRASHGTAVLLASLLGVIVAAVLLSA